MLDHLSIQVDDLAAASAFYDAVLAPLGSTRIMEFDGQIAYGEAFPRFWISRATDRMPNRPCHIAFTAPDRAAVRAFAAEAVGLGAEVLHEPRLWPEYHEHYYGVFVRDPDGNNVEAVCHAPEEP